MENKKSSPAKFLFGLGAAASIGVIGTGLSLFGASKARKQAKRQAASQLAFQQEQAAKLEEQKDIYRNMTFTNS